MLLFYKNNAKIKVYYYATRSGDHMETDNNNTALQLVELLKKYGLKIAAAESLTGGMISEMITSVPGASEIIELGICSYSNRIKHEILGVSQKTLDELTEYSHRTVCEMAEGVRRMSGADIGISTSGIAGPSGGTPDKPVGTVFIGVSSSLGTRSILSPPDGNESREKVRVRAALAALALAAEEARRLSGKLPE